MPPAGGLNAGQLYAELMLIDDPFFRRLAQISAQAGQQSQQIGRQMGQGVSQGFNQSGGLGFANNFIFAIQDAGSAIGQFGVTTTGLRFAVLGAANNLQTMAMSATMAGISFKTLLASITPVHIGLAAFSLAISLLPLAFANSSKGAGEFASAMKTLGEVMDRFYARQQMGVSMMENRTEAIKAQKAALEDLLVAHNKQTKIDLQGPGAFRRFVAEMAGFVLSGFPAGRVAESMILGDPQKDIAAREKKIAEEQAQLRFMERQQIEQARKTAEATGIMIFGALSGGVSGVPSVRQQAKIDANVREQARKEAEAREKAIAEAPGIDLELRERELNIAKLHMEMAGGGGKFEFMSPDQYINQLQGKITTGEERMIKNQELQLQLDKEWFQLDKAREDKLKNQGIINAGR